MFLILVQHLYYIFFFVYAQAQMCPFQNTITSPLNFTEMCTSYGDVMINITNTDPPIFSISNNANWVLGDSIVCAEYSTLKVSDNSNVSVSKRFILQDSSKMCIFNNSQITVSEEVRLQNSSETTLNEYSTLNSFNLFYIEGEAIFRMNNHCNFTTQSFLKILENATFVAENKSEIILASALNIFGFANFSLVSETQLEAHGQIEINELAFFKMCFNVYVLSYSYFRVLDNANVEICNNSVLQIKSFLEIKGNTTFLINSGSLVNATDSIRIQQAFIEINSYSLLNTFKDIEITNVENFYLDSSVNENGVVENCASQFEFKRIECDSLRVRNTHFLISGNSFISAENSITLDDVKFVLSNRTIQDFPIIITTRVDTINLPLITYSDSFDIFCSRSVYNGYIPTGTHLYFKQLLRYGNLTDFFCHVEHFDYMKNEFKFTEPYCPPSSMPYYLTPLKNITSFLLTINTTNENGKFDHYKKVQQNISSLNNESAMVGTFNIFFCKTETFVLGINSISKPTITLFKLTKTVLFISENYMKYGNVYFNAALNNASGFYILSGQRCELGYRYNSKTQTCEFIYECIDANCLDCSYNRSVCIQCPYNYYYENGRCIEIINCVYK
ncbi:hypothetical protein EIN_511920, partial [Entamoeba invadens IP1]